jgi:DNA-3-methyladenine glycosylase II
MTIVTPAAIEYLLTAEPIIRKIHDLYGSPVNWSRPPGFVSLCRIILEQQVSLASANAHYLKLNSYVNDFTPANILKLTDEEMRTCQISRQKTKYLRALSDAIITGDLNLESISELTEPEIRHQLTRINGIGDWTADIYLMFCLQKPDIFPVGDIAIVSAVRELTSAITKDEMLNVAEQWRPYRSLATYYLWFYYLKKRGRI